MSAITILKENVPHGPLTRAQVADELSRGEVTLESLAFVDGLSQWTPLRDVLAKVDAMQPVPPVVSALAATTGHAHTPATATAARMGTGYSYAATMQPPEHLVFAGFWLRFVAYLIDTLLLTTVSVVAGIVIGVVLGVVVSLVDKDALPTAITIMQVIMYGVVFIAAWLYFAFMESSRLQATLGKMALGLQVTNQEGQRISFGCATGRFFGKIVSGITLYIGYMMAGWTQRKQALHDMLVDTLVVRKPRV